MRPERFDPRAYWEERLSHNLSLRGTGHRAFSLAYNDRLYQAQQDCVDLLFAHHTVDLTRQRALDVGSGNGFFVDLWLKKGAAEVVGLDITLSSVAHLAAHFPGQRFAVSDVTAPSLPVVGDFRLVSCISVLYHVVDDGKFEQALSNLCHHVAAGGYLLVSDTLRRSLLPTARHARFRTLAEYTPIFERHDLEVVDVLPLYYLLNRTVLPLIGPRVLSLLHLEGPFYRQDAAWRSQGRDNGDGMKLLLAKRRST